MCGKMYAECFSPRESNCKMTGLQWQKKGQPVRAGHLLWCLILRIGAEEGT